METMEKTKYQEGIICSIEGISSLIGEYDTTAVHSLGALSSAGKTILALTMAYDYSHQTGRKACIFDTEAGAGRFVKLWDKALKKRFPKAQTPLVFMARNLKHIFRAHGEKLIWKVSEKGKISPSFAEVMVEGQRYKDDDGKIKKAKPAEFIQYIRDNDVGFVIYDSFSSPFATEVPANMENLGGRAFLQGVWLRKIIDLVIDKEGCIVWALHHLCHDAKTLAVTRDGIKSFNELSLKDEVLTLNGEGKQEWNKINKIHIYDHDGVMVRIKGKSVDQLVTANHRVMHLDETTKELKYKKAIEMSKHYDIIPKASLVNSDIIDSFSRDAMLEPLAYLAGWYVAEGYTHIKLLNSGHETLTARLCLSHKDLEFVIPALDKAKIHYWVNIQKEESGKLEYLVQFNSQELGYMILHSGKIAKEKRVPDDIMNGSDYQKRAFIYGYLQGDGSKAKYCVGRHGKKCEVKGWIFSTISENLIHSLSVLAMSLGLSVTYSKRMQKGFGKGNIIYTGSVTNRNVAYSRLADIEDYKGKVWCVEVDNYNFAVVRNGKICFSGNTKNPTIPQAREALLGGKNVQHYSKVQLIMKKFDAQGANIYRKLILARFYNEEEWTKVSYMKMTSKGFVDASIEEKDEAAKDAKAKRNKKK